MPLVYDDGAFIHVQSVLLWKLGKGLRRLRRALTIEHETIPILPQVRTTLQTGDLSDLITDFRSKAEVFPFEQHQDNEPPEDESSAVGQEGN